MRFYSETLGLSDAAFAVLRDLIHERTGLYYDDGKRDTLADKLSPRVVERGLSSFLDYYYLLKYDPAGEDEWGHVMDALSVGETYFWREVDQIHALVREIVPRHFSDTQAAPLRIWSAACASGEEPLSIAIALHEAGWLGRAPIELYASDASPTAVEKARRGLYRERSFRNLPSHLRQRYFTEENGVWRIAPELHARVVWQVVNLMDTAQVAVLARAHVIFCRNVFIYFSEQAIRKTVQLFYEQMPRPGYLFVGAAESLLRLGVDFNLRDIAGAFVYVKE